MLEFTWRVILNCRLVGYVTSMSETGALRKAKDKYGNNVWIERVAELNK